MGLLTKWGASIFYFVLVYSIITAILAYFVTMYGIEPPRALTIVTFPVEEVTEGVEYSVSGEIVVEDVKETALVSFLTTLVYNMIMGMPALFSTLASMIGLSHYIGLFVGGLFQTLAMYYVLSRLISLLPDF